MANARLITPNYADEATLTASPALVATLPVTNLQDPMRGTVARSTSLVAQTYNIDLDSAKNLNSITIERHNYSPAATIRYRIWASAAQSGALLYDSGSFTNGTVIPWGTLRWGIDPWGGSNIFTGWAYAWTKLYHADVIGARSASVLVTDAANADGYIEASRLRIGSYFSPEMNATAFEPRWQDPTTQIRTAGGSLRSDNVTSFRAFELEFARLTTAEATVLYDISRVIGLKNDLFVDVWPEAGGAIERDFSSPVKFVQDMRFPYHPDTGTYSTKMSFQES